MDGADRKSARTDGLSATRQCFLASLVDRLELTTGPITERAEIQPGR